MFSLSIHVHDPADSVFKVFDTHEFVRTSYQTIAHRALGFKVFSGRFPDCIDYSPRGEYFEEHELQRADCLWAAEQIALAGSEGSINFDSYRDDPAAAEYSLNVKIGQCSPEKVKALFTFARQIACCKS